MALDFYENADSVSMRDVTRERGADGWDIVAAGATDTDPVVFWVWFRKPDPPKPAPRKRTSPATPAA